jgi:hypothetical protein
MLLAACRREGEVLARELPYRAEKALDYSKTDVKEHVSREALRFLSGLKRAKSAPYQGTGYACA